MRTTARISLLTLPVLLTLPAGCDRATQPEFTVRPPEPQNSVAYLKSLCDGKSSVAIAQDITIRGFVTANDLYGEFHRTIVVEDASGGISIAAEGSPLADLYPFGIVATVRCNGLTLCDYGGKIQLGTTPGDGGAGCIPREELARYIRTEPPGGETPSAQLLTFDAVSARHIDTRVRFDDVRFADAGKTWCDTDPETGRAVATEREIVDTRGRTFTVRTAATCVYAKEPAPGHRLLVWNHRLFRREIHPARHQPRSGVFRHGSAFRSNTPSRRTSGADNAGGGYRCNASHSISLSRGMFSPETDE